MASDLNNAKFTKTRGSVFPVIESLTITSAVSIIVNCTGANAVNFEFTNLGETGTIEPGETKTFISNGDPITDVIDFTFNGAAEIEVSYATGAGSVPAGGSASAANQLIIISFLDGTTTSVFSGNSETISVVEETTVGAKTTDVALSMSIRFFGAGGTINSILVPDGYMANWSGTMRNEISTIGYTVPTSADFNGFQKVTITYSKK
jgi:hypothetical protein